MTNNLKLILATFNKQRNLNDCGIACLLSVLKYAGIGSGHITSDNMDQSSLLDLHKMAGKAGVISRCVKMDIETLRNNSSPCILHVLNETGQPHFIVHYSYHKEPGFHLIGDPDRKIELITEESLMKKWESRAALFFENVQPRNDWSYRLYPWNSFAGFKFIPKILWWAVPFLNVIAALLGLAVSLIIQKALEPGFLNGKQTFFILLFTLLVLISVAKCSINYLRQWMMISLGSEIDSKLSSMFLNNMYRSFRPSIRYINQYYLKTIAEVQKIHQAVALLIGVVFSDGLIVMIMLGCLFFYQPALVLFEVAVFIAMFIIIDRNLPLLLIHSDNIQVPLIRAIDQQIVNPAQSVREMEYESFEANYLRLNEGYSKTAKYLSVMANKINLSFEVISTINIVLVLIFSICKLQAQLISYESFLMIILLCYGMGMLMTKICNQLFNIAQGANMLKQNQSPEIIDAATDTPL